jgi:hypothetical protein
VVTSLKTRAGAAPGAVQGGAHTADDIEMPNLPPRTGTGPHAGDAPTPHSTGGGGGRVEDAPTVHGPGTGGGAPRPDADDAASVHSTDSVDSYHTAPRPDADDAASVHSTDSVDSYHTAPRPDADDAASVHSTDSVDSYHTAPRPDADDAAPAPAPAPAATQPWTKAHDAWLKDRFPDAYAKYKTNETWLRENHPESFKLFKEWIADSHSVKEYWAWPIKGSREVIKQMLDIQQTAQAGWAAEQQPSEQQPSGQQQG